MKTAPVEMLKDPATPRRGDWVLFRPWGVPLDKKSQWNHWTVFWPRDWNCPEPERKIAGCILALKRRGDEFYYRISSGVHEWDVSPHEVWPLPHGLIPGRP
jgi:hypothetical protein